MLWAVKGVHMTYAGKTFLLIAGGGTLGTYTAKELLSLGASVEIVCPEEKHSDHPRLSFHRALGTAEVLSELFAKKHYDGIVDFICYRNHEDYYAIYPLLIANTDHLVFLSSYRVYSDRQLPITETAPRLYDVITDRHFLETENYAVPKSKCEDFLRNEHGSDPWTIVRPVISFSARRLDLLLYSKQEVLEAVEKNRALLLPETVRSYGAGIDWAGNSGKLIAHLLGKPHTHGETYTVCSGHGMTWGQVADAYSEVTGLQVRWCDEAEYVEKVVTPDAYWRWYYDRIYDRTMDVSKVLAATGLTKADFATVAEGLRTELDLLGWKKP